MKFPRKQMFRQEVCYVAGVPEVQCKIEGLKFVGRHQCQGIASDK